MERLQTETIQPALSRRLNGAPRNEPIGRGRTRGKEKHPRVDDSGIIRVVDEFRDADGSEPLLMESRDRFLRAFVEHPGTLAHRRLPVGCGADGTQWILEKARNVLPQTLTQNSEER